MSTPFLMPLNAPTGHAKRSPRALPDFSRPLLMGIVNVTPDSFYAASRADSTERAIALGLSLAAQGADILDIGGQSTRPGSEPISIQAERERVIPVIRELARQIKIPISVDTDKAAVAAEALAAGARIINDVSALRHDPAMLNVALQAERVVLMHRLGADSKTMQNDPRYSDCVKEIGGFLKERMRFFCDAGGRKSQVWIDPGIGFGKALEHNLALIRDVGALSAIAPVVLGVSRKSMFAKINPDNGPDGRLAGSLAIAAWACWSSVAVLRVHDVEQTRQVVETLQAVARA